MIDPRRVRRLRRAVAELLDAQFVLDHRAAEHSERLRYLAEVAAARRAGTYWRDRDARRTATRPIHVEVDTQALHGTYASCSCTSPTSPMPQQAPRTGTLELITQHRLETNAINDVRDRTHVLLSRLGAAAETNGPPNTTESEWVNNAATSGAVEFTTHGWDLYAALGQPRQIPDALAQAVLEITSEAIDSASRDPQFAQPVNIDPSRPPSDQLLGFLGRHPHPST